MVLEYVSWVSSTWKLVRKAISPTPHGTYRVRDSEDGFQQPVSNNLLRMLCCLLRVAKAHRVLVQKEDLPPRACCIPTMVTVHHGDKKSQAFLLSSVLIIYWELPSPNRCTDRGVGGTKRTGSTLGLTGKAD